MKMIKHVLATLTLSAATLLVASCAVPGGSAGAGGALAGDGSDSAIVNGVGPNADFSGQVGSFTVASLVKQYNTIYFSYDSNDIKPWALKPLNANAGHDSNPQPSAKQVIDGYAIFLTKNPSVHITLAGNTDKRGSRAYNLALGERRAKAVEQELEMQGVSSSQITVISYGKEEPVALGNDEGSYSQNRRVNMKFGA
ncbi:MAG: OmpA family protein [Legionellales bacterium]|nr:OmpA family protein [Legionellales bacterium]